MKNTITLFATAALLAASAQGRSVPEHVRALYNSIRQQGSCDNELKGGFYSQEQDSKGRTKYLPGLTRLALNIEQTSDTVVTTCVTLESYISKVKMATWSIWISTVTAHWAKVTAVATAPRIHRVKPHLKTRLPAMGKALMTSMLTSIPMSYWATKEAPQAM